MAARTRWLPETGRALVLVGLLGEPLPALRRHLGDEREAPVAVGPEDDRAALLGGGAGDRPDVAEMADQHDVLVVRRLVGEERAAELLDPARYLGSAGALVDRALDFYDREG